MALVADCTTVFASWAETAPVHNAKTTSTTHILFVINSSSSFESGFESFPHRRNDWPASVFFPHCQPSRPTLFSSFSCDAGLFFKIRERHHNSMQRRYGSWVQLQS